MNTQSLSRGALQVLQVLGGPLALLPDSRQQLLDIVERHAYGDTRDLSAIQAKLGRPLGQEARDGYSVINGVAILPVAGVIFPKSNLLMDVSGGASAQLIARDVAQAAADPSVKAIVLSVDSPGGSVLGIPEASQAIRDAAQAKPVVAHSDGAIASAAYWLGSAANTVWLSGPGVMVGSLGVVATHTDTSRADAQAGIKKTEITAGKYKRIASGNAPLDAEGAATIQAQVDYLYSLLVDGVAANRGVTSAVVLANMADGRVFIGRQAIDAGLADGFSSLDQLVASLASNPAQYAKRGAAPGRAAQAAPKAAAAQAYGAAFEAEHGISLSCALEAINGAAQAPPPTRLHQSGNPPPFEQQEQRMRFHFAAAGTDEKDAQAEAAQAFAERHGVSILVASKALGFLSSGVGTSTAAAAQSAESLAAAAATQRSAAVAAQATSMLRLLSEATGMKPNTDVMERVRPGLPGRASANARPAARASPVPTVVNPDRLAAQRAAADRAVALFNKTNGVA